MEYLKNVDILKAVSRRKLLTHFSKGFAASYTIRIPVLITFFHSGHASGQGKAYDLVMMGYSNIDGQKLGKAGELKAEQIAAGKVLSGLVYEQDDHGHTFDLTVEHLTMLLSSKTVEVITTTMQGHNHKVKIDPAAKVNPNAPGINVSGAGTDPIGTDAQPTSDIRTFLDERCTDCHHPGAASPMDMTGKLTKAQVDAMITRVKTTDPEKIMPPGFRGALTESEVATFENLLRAIAE